MLTRFKSKFTPLEKIGPSSSGANNGTFNSLHAFFYVVD